MNSNTETKIFIVDDDQTTHDGLSSLLDSQDELRAVITAENDQKAFAQLQAHPVDLVLLDVNMPVMSGTETVHKLRLEYPDIIIMMLITSEYVESLGQTLGAEVREFLTKDIPAVEVVGLARKAHNGQQVMGARPIRILAENYIRTQQDRE